MPPDLKGKSFFVFPKICGQVAQGKCDIIRETLEEELAKKFKGFTRWDCDGAWVDDDKTIMDSNLCYIVGHQDSEPTRRKIRDAVVKSGRKAGEYAVLTEQEGTMRVTFTKVVEQQRRID